MLGTNVDSWFVNITQEPAKVEIVLKCSSLLHKW